MDDIKDTVNWGIGLGIGTAIAGSALHRMNRIGSPIRRKKKKKKGRLYKY